MTDEQIKALRFYQRNAAFNEKERAKSTHNVNDSSTSLRPIGEDEASLPSAAFVPMGLMTLPSSLYAPPPGYRRGRGCSAIALGAGNIAIGADRSSDD